MLYKRLRVNISDYKPIEFCLVQSKVIFENKYPTSNMSKEKEASPDQDEFLDCKDCTKTFFTKSGLKIHSRNQHKLKKGSEKKVDQCKVNKRTRNIEKKIWNFKRDYH